MTTFRVTKNKPERVSFLKGKDEIQSPKILETLQVYQKSGCVKILQATKLEDKVEIVHKNGFVSTVFDCYNNHHNLVIRPDDVWIAIMTQFSFFVNKHAEKLRGQFVNFEGKKCLEVTLPAGTMRTTEFSLFAKLISKKIDDTLVDGTVKSWVIPSFSTTTDEDIVVGGLVLMGSMKKYFKYRGIIPMCGIPEVTLLGTVDDWRNIKERIGKLKEYGLDTWHSRLQEILTEFINAAEGNPNIEFWEKICNAEYRRLGSGGDHPVTYIDGWITLFCAFDEDGNVSHHRLELDEVPSGVVQVEAEFLEVATSKTYQTKFFAGHVGREILQDGCQLQPKIGWALGLVSVEVTK